MALTIHQTIKSQITLANDLGTSSPNRLTVLSIISDSTITVANSEPDIKADISKHWKRIREWADHSGIRLNAYVQRHVDHLAYSHTHYLVLEFDNNIDLANYKLSFKTS